MSLALSPLARLRRVSAPAARPLAAAAFDGRAKQGRHTSARWRSSRVEEPPALVLAHILRVVALRRPSRPRCGAHRELGIGEHS